MPCRLMPRRPLVGFPRRRHAALAESSQAPTVHVHPDGSRPSLNIEHSALQSNSLMPGLQS